MSWNIPLLNPSGIQDSIVFLFFLIGSCLDSVVFYLALILREEGEVQQSLDVFQQCVQLNQHNPDHLKQVARSLYAFIPIPGFPK